jgi:hypothetical protein
MDVSELQATYAWTFLHVCGIYTFNALRRICMVPTCGLFYDIVS